MPLRPTFARRLSDIEPFRVVAVLTRAKELERQGRDIVHLGAGEPDFATADPIVQAGRQALADGRTYYSQAGGIPQLREALSGWYQQEYGLAIDPDRIMITPGADFGRHRASDYVRFSYTTGMECIEEAVARMTRVLS